MAEQPPKSLREFILTWVQKKYGYCGVLILLIVLMVPSAVWVLAQGLKWYEEHTWDTIHTQINSLLTQSGRMTFHASSTYLNREKSGYLNIQQSMSSVGENKCIQLLEQTMEWDLAYIDNASEPGQFIKIERTTIALTDINEVHTDEFFKISGENISLTRLGDTHTLYI